MNRQLLEIVTCVVAGVVAGIVAAVYFYFGPESNILGFVTSCFLGFATAWVLSIANNRTERDGKVDVRGLAIWYAGAIVIGVIFVKNSTTITLFTFDLYGFSIFIGAVAAFVHVLWTRHPVA